MSTTALVHCSIKMTNYHMFHILTKYLFTQYFIWILTFSKLPINMNDDDTLLTLWIWTQSSIHKRKFEMEMPNCRIKYLLQACIKLLVHFTVVYFSSLKFHIMVHHACLSLSINMISYVLIRWILLSCVLIWDFSVPYPSFKFIVAAFSWFLKHTRLASKPRIGASE